MLQWYNDAVMVLEVEFCMSCEGCWRWSCGGVVVLVLWKWCCDGVVMEALTVIIMW